MHHAASDMCQSDLFTLVNCLKALQLDAVHPSWQRESMIRCALFMLLQKTRSSNKNNRAHKWQIMAVCGSMRWTVAAKVPSCWGDHTFFCYSSKKYTELCSKVGNYLRWEADFPKGVRTPIFTLENPLLGADPACLHPCSPASSGEALALWHSGPFCHHKYSLRRPLGLVKLTLFSLNDARAV